MLSVVQPRETGLIGYPAGSAGHGSAARSPERKLKTDSAGILGCFWWGVFRVG